MAAIGSGRLFQRLVALALAFVLALAVWGLMFGPEGADRGGLGDASAARQALGDWEALWSDLAERGEAALRPEVADPSLRAAGDTVFMRYRNLWGRIDGSERLAFQLSALSGDPAHKLSLIEPLTRAEDPRIRFRAHLEQARLQRRLHEFAAARAAAAAALAVPDLPERVRADAWFILADIAWEEARLDEAETAATAAIAADPGFWDARRLRLAVLARQLARPRQAAHACLDRTRLMIQDLGALPALAQDQTQFRDLADRLALQGAPPNVALTLIAGLGYLWAGDIRGAESVLAGAERVGGRLPAVCERLILERIAEWRPRAGTRQATPADPVPAAGDALRAGTRSDRP